jgi:chromosome segregation ATPase
MRQDELGEFNGEEKDLLQSISSLKGALTVLEKHQGGSSLLQVSAALQRGLDKHPHLIAGVLTPKERQAATSFIQTVHAPEGSYSPASGQVFGILSQMRETFETNLAASQKEEMESQKAYEELKAAKDAEIAAGIAQIDDKTQEMADTDEKLAQAKEDLEDTKNSLAADEAFLADLKAKCAATDAEFDERTKTRQEELQACSKALSFLNSDEAHDLFTKTFNFAQVAVMKSSERREQASNVLSAAAHKMQSPRLAALAVSVKLDAFEKVKKAIDDMIAQLLQDKADEIKHKDFCVEEFNTNKLQTEKADRTKADLEAKIEDLTMNIEELTKAIATLKSEIAEMQVQMKRAGEDREKENKAFQLTVADQRATQKLLQMALNVLADFYGKAALLQQPAGFDAYKKNAASGGVMGMIKTIIGDAKKAEADAIRGESDAQTAYESFVKETNASIEAKGKDIANKSETKAGLEGDLVQAQESLASTNGDLDDLAKYNAELHASCDFVQENFEIRQTGRDEEVAALRQAKAILSGAKFEQFLQRS